jgi:hypothetical protein
MLSETQPVFQTIPSDLEIELNPSINRDILKHVKNTLSFLADGVVSFLGETNRNEIEIQICLIHIQNISRNLTLKKDNTIDNAFRFCVRTNSLKVNESLYKSKDPKTKLNLLIELGYAYQCTTELKKLTLPTLKDKLATYIEESVLELEEELFFEHHTKDVETPLGTSKKSQAFLKEFRSKMREKLFDRLEKNKVFQTNPARCDSLKKELARKTIYQSVCQFEDLTSLEHTPSIRDLFMCQYMFEEEDTAIESIEELFNSKDKPFWTASLSKLLELDDDSILRKNDVSRVLAQSEVSSIGGVSNLFELGSLSDREAFDLLSQIENSKESKSILFHSKNEIGLYKLKNKKHSYILVCGDKYTLKLNFFDAWWAIIL